MAARSRTQIISMTVQMSMMARRSLRSAVAPAEEREQKQRDELDEADHADQEGALIDGAREAGDGVNLPAEGDAFGLDCEGGEDAGGPQEGEGAELEDGRGI